MGKIQGRADRRALRRMPDRGASGLSHGLRLAEEAGRHHRLRRTGGHGRGHLHGGGGAVLMHFTQKESCGKCTPCREGTKRMLETLERIIANEGSPDDLELLEALSDTITDTALCGLGQTACKPVMSTLRHFRQDYLHHVVDHHCPICNGRRRRLEIKADLCKAAASAPRTVPWRPSPASPACRIPSTTRSASIAAHAGARVPSALSTP